MARPTWLVAYWDDDARRRVDIGDILVDIQNLIFLDDTRVDDIEEWDSRDD